MGSIHIQFRASPELHAVLPNLETMKGHQIRDALVAKAKGFTSGILPSDGAVYSLAKKLVLLMVRAGIDSEAFDVPITDAEVQQIVDDLKKEGTI
jgi:hypothetical protein